MKQASGIGRLAGLAVGLGIGAALAATPGVASADDLDFQISIDGYDLLPTAGNEASATTTAGDLGIAIAIGDGASATATPEASTRSSSPLSATVICPGQWRVLRPTLNMAVPSCFGSKAWSGPGG